MIKAAIQYILDRATPNIVTVDGREYSNQNLNVIKKRNADPINVRTLTGLVDYIKSDFDDNAIAPVMVHVVSPTCVHLFSELDNYGGRETYVVTISMLPELTLDRFVSSEEFIINLQSSFIGNEDSARVLQCVGNIQEENIRNTHDDGVSQEVTVKSGIARKIAMVVPNPVTLKPYRTFQEIEQPESKFIFRMKEGPTCGLFEADGGAWKIEAMASIKAYLVEKLDGLLVDVIA